MILIATMTVKQEKLAAFHEFERHAAAVMESHGGRIERTIVVTTRDSPDLHKEVHIVTFADEADFAAYRRDARLAAVQHLRDESVLHTDILIGVAGPIYGA